MCARTSFVGLTRITAILAVAAVLLAPRPAGAQDVQVVGYYATEPGLAITGDQVAFSLTILLKNESDHPVGTLRVSLVRANESADGRELDADAVLASFPPLTLPPGQSARQHAQVVIPLDEWQRWGSGGPSFWMTYVDDEAFVVSVPLMLMKTGAIPDRTEPSPAGGAR